MIQAHLKADIYGGLLDKVISFIFLAVPHRGADTAFWLELFANLSKIAHLGFKGNKKFAKALRANSPKFAEISAQSAGLIQSASISIRTFYEDVRMANLMVC